MQKLRSLRSAVVDESFNILLKTVYRILHLLIPRLGITEAGFQLQELLIYSFVLGENSASLPRDSLIFALLGSNSLIL
jgi:hypothetical protein